MIFRVEKISGKLAVVRIRVLARAQADGGEPFHFLHPEADRFPMRLNETFIEERHDRDGFLRRTLKIVEPDRMGDVASGEPAAGLRMDVLLKLPELFLRDRLIEEMKILGKRTAPDALNGLVFGEVIVAREMTAVKVRTIPLRCFDFGTGKHPIHSG